MFDLLEFYCVTEAGKAHVSGDSPLVEASLPRWVRFCPAHSAENSEADLGGVDGSGHVAT